MVLCPACPGQRTSNVTEPRIGVALEEKRERREIQLQRRYGIHPAAATDSRGRRASRHAPTDAASSSAHRGIQRPGVSIGARRPSVPRRTLQMASVERIPSGDPGCCRHVAMTCPSSVRPNTSPDRIHSPTSEHDPHLSPAGDRYDPRCSGSRPRAHGRRQGSARMARAWPRLGGQAGGVALNVIRTSAAPIVRAQGRGGAGGHCDKTQMAGGPCETGRLSDMGIWHVLGSTISQGRCVRACEHAGV